MAALPSSTLSSGCGERATDVLSLLHAARDGGYALGAFNVYDMNGAAAVIDAAEAAKSPVILQVKQQQRFTFHVS